MIGVIALLNLLLIHTASLGLLYIIPLVLMAGFLTRWQLVALAVGSAILREAGSLTPWSDDYLTRLTLVAMAFAGAALFVKELAQNEQVALERVQELRQRQQLERQLLHAQRLEAVGRLAGGIAHDFNNLLSVIIGFSDLALRQLEPESSVSRDLEQVQKAADRATGLTRQLLEFSRRDMLQPRVMDLNALIQHLSHMLRRVIGEHIDLNLMLDPRVNCVTADAGSMEQVVMNLVVNARDAMPNGGKLTVQTSEVWITALTPWTPPGIQPGRYVTLAVQDTGVGMNADTQEHLFEPFYTTKEAGKGTGLGLSTAYGIVKQNGGAIWFESEPGVGTTFTIYLPPTEAAPEAAKPAANSLSYKMSATVLLVEDDDGVRELTREILGRNGLTVVEARNPSEAISISQRASFQCDLLVTDVVMPSMRGTDLAEIIRQDRPNLHVLFMTGYNDASIPPDSAGPGGTTLIQKPLSEQSLMQAVRTALGRNASGAAC